MSRRQAWRDRNLDARIVDRRTKWGNPFIVGEFFWNYLGSPVPLRPDQSPPPGRFGARPWTRQVADNTHAAELFRWWMAEGRTSGALALRESIHELRGKDLACWCPLDKPCHADVLLWLANQ